MLPLQWLKRILGAANLVLVLLLVLLTARKLPAAGNARLLPIVAPPPVEATPTPYVAGPTPTPLPPTPTPAGTRQAARPSPTPQPAAQARLAAAAPSPTTQPGTVAGLARPSPTGAPPQPTSTPVGTAYTVSDGDTLWGIARKFNTTVAVVATANKLDPDAPLRPGQKLFIPPPE